MNYNFERVYTNGRVLSMTEFRHMLSFTHAYNNVIKRGITGEANILRELIAQGFSDASALNQVVKRITGEGVPTSADEHEFMGEYYNYTQKTLEKAKAEKQKLEEKLKNEKLYVDADGNKYSAEELKTLGQTAKKKSRLPKWARFGAVVLGVVIGSIVPVLAAGILAPYITASALASTIFNVASIALPIVGGFVAKNRFDKSEMGQNLKKNSMLAKLFEENKDKIREQEIAIARANARVNELQNAFGIEVDAQGNETANAYNDLYNAYARYNERASQGAAQNVAPSQGNNNQNANAGRTAQTQLDPSFGKQMTAEDIDNMINDVYGSATSLNNNPRTLDPSFGRNMTTEDINEMINDVYGQEPETQSDASSEEESGSGSAVSNVPPVIIPPSREDEGTKEFNEEYKKDAKDYADYIERKRYSGIVPQEEVYNLGKYVKETLNTVLDEEKSTETRMNAFVDLKDTYADTRHRVNMQKLAPVVKQFSDYKKANKEFEDGNFDLLISKIGEIKNGYENSNDISIEGLDKQIENIKFEEGLVDIAETYGRVVDNQTRLANAENIIMAEDQKSKYSTWSTEHGKFMHIIIENACDERETLDELEDMIEGDKHEYISYMACRRDAKEINDHIKRRTRNNVVAGILTTGQEVEPQIVEPTLPDEFKEVRKEDETISAEAEEKAPELSPLIAADEIMLRESINRKQKAELKRLAEEQEAARKAAEAQKLAEEKAQEEAERKERRRRNMERQKAIFEAEPTAEELDELKETEQSNLPPQMSAVFKVLEEQNVQPSGVVPVEKKQPMATDLYKEEKIKAIEKLVKENRRTPNAAGRYLISVVTKEAIDSIKQNQTAQEVDEKCEKAERFVNTIVKNYRLYTEVDIQNKKNNVKVNYYREINQNDSKDGITKGPKCDVTIVKGFTGVEAQEHYNAVLEDYIKDYGQSCKGVVSLMDSSVKDVTPTIKKAQNNLRKQIKEAISNGQHPLAAIDSVMIKAYNELEGFVRDNIENIDRMEQEI